MKLPIRLALAPCLVAAWLAFAHPVGAQSVCGDCGPVDGQSNILDALTSAQHAAGILTLSAASQLAADVHPASGGSPCDGDVDILDALSIAQGAAGVIAVLNCCLGPPPDAPQGMIRYPGGGTHRDDIPVRFAASDPDFDLLEILFQHSTDGGSTWVASTMSPFVTEYPAGGIGLTTDSDDASYVQLFLTAGVGSFQVGEVVMGGTSGATGVVYRQAAPPPGTILALLTLGGTFLECEAVSGMSSGASGMVDGTGCGGIASGIGPFSRPLILGTALFQSGVPASTANPITGVFPSEYLTFVWDSSADIGAGASPATVRVRVVLDDGTTSVPSAASAPFTVDNRPPATDHLLITEMSITGGEFVEIHNPTSAPIDLTDYYLTDATYPTLSHYYWHIVGTGSPGGGFNSDWFARFPAGAMIMPGEYQVVAGSDTQFFSRYLVHADYELCLPCAGTVPCMTAVAGGIDAAAACGAMAGTSALTDSGETVVLFHWDGVAPIVDDVDYIVWGDQVEAIDKTAVPGYLPDTPVAMQEILPPGFPEGDLHNVVTTAARVDLEEGTETSLGGNGISGHDETSENFSATWTYLAVPTPGRPNFILPPYDAAIVRGALVVNEVCYDPASDANGDGAFDAYEDAFIEVVNDSTTMLDLTNLKIYNLRTVFGISHIFPRGTQLMPGQAVLVFGGGAPAGSGCGALDQVSTTGGLFFNIGTACSSADGIVLVNGGIEVDSDYQCNNAINASFTRDPDLTGPRVDHTTVPGALEFSPGCRSDGVSGF